MKALHKGFIGYLKRLGLTPLKLRRKQGWISEPHQDGHHHLHTVLFKGEAR